MKEAEQEKRNPLLDSIDLDYTSSSCLIDQVDEGADDNDSAGDGAGQGDFLLGDMDLMFDGSQGDSSALDADGGEEKKSAGSKHKYPPTNMAQRASSGSSAMFPDEIKMESKPLSNPAMAAAAVGSGEDTSNSRSWHSKTGDKQARQTMIGEIARLLKSRKKTEPSEEWIKQLPHKARKLEERLYRSAPSLRAYQDLSTLKTRLLRVARDITKRYNGMKTRHSISSSRGSIRRGSSVSMSTTLSSLRNSLSSQSQGGYRDSISAGALNQQMAAFSNSLSIPSSVDARNNSVGSRPSLKALSEEMLSGRSRGGATSTSLEGSDQSQKMNKSQSNEPTSMIEQQKALNEKLRLEIEQNLRTQNELFQKMKAQQSGRPNMLTPAAQLQRQSSQSSAGQMGATAPSLQQTHQIDSVQQVGGFNNQIGQANGPASSQLNNPMAMAALPNRLGGQFGSHGQGMTGVQQQQQQQQQMLSTQNIQGIQAAQNMQGIGGHFQGGNDTGLASSNQQSAAARLQMQALLAQPQQQQQTGGFNRIGNQMQFQGMQGQFNQQQQGQMQQQQQMLNMLRGPQVMPQTAQAVSTGGSMPPPPVQKAGGADPKGSSNPPISPGAFNW
mmetsp:Transcript_15215/g.33294  ORF Transcript_15215/g.33294 Transcript_15215/m.33294 type:complete len:611 (+) Transcript_15215:122-1954(+)